MLKTDSANNRHAAAPGLYKSNALGFFIEAMASSPDATVLDVGPVCGETISFFSSRAARLYVCDLYREATRTLASGESAAKIFQQLDYPPESFSGILLWDLLSRFGDSDAVLLVRRCREMVTPGGYVVVTASGEKAASGTVNSFVVGPDCSVNFRPQPHLRLPVTYRQNRDILHIMKPFIQIRSFIYRNGIREFLFRAS